MAEDRGTEDRGTEHRDTEDRGTEHRDIARRRAGLTLVELLLVVSILVLMVAATLPVVQPALEGRKLREGARLINTYFAGAQARAAENGRPVGVWLERTGNGTACYQMFMAETHPPYVGDVDYATCEYSYVAPTATTGAKHIVSFDRTENLSLLRAAGIVQLNDLVKFNYKGPLYRIVEFDESTDPSKILVRLASRGDTPRPPDDVPLRYQIYRRPTKSIVSPLELPAGIVVDLLYSGIGASGTFARNNEPIIIVFHPAGAIERIYLAGFAPGPPLGPVHLLVGRYEQIEPDGSPPTSENLRDSGNLWISINNRTGMITSSENAWHDTGAATLPAAREYARKGQSLGGR